MKKFLLAMLASAILAAPAQAARKPKNPRRAKKAAPAAAAPAAALNHAVPAEDRLEPGRWTPEVRESLEKLIFEKGASSGDYDARRPPIAAFLWTRCALDGDPSEALFHKLLERVEFKFNDAFWKEVPLGFGRQRARSAHEQLAAIPREAWGPQPAYRQFKKAFAKGYRDMCAKTGIKECRVYLAELLKGFELKDLREYAAQAISEEAARPFEEQRYVDEDGDPDPVVFTRGLKPIPELAALAKKLRERGWDVWALSPDAQPVLELSVPLYGIDPSRAVGIAQGFVNKTELDGKAAEPIPVRGGAVEVVTSRFGRVPQLVVGCSDEHREILTYGSGARLVLERGDPGLRATALSRDWMHETALPASGKKVR